MADNSSKGSRDIMVMECPGIGGHVLGLRIYSRRCCRIQQFQTRSSINGYILLDVSSAAVGGDTASGSIIGPGPGCHVDVTPRVVTILERQHRFYVKITKYYPIARAWRLGRAERAESAPFRPRAFPRHINDVLVQYQ